MALEAEGPGLSGRWVSRAVRPGAAPQEKTADREGREGREERERGRRCAAKRPAGLCERLTGDGPAPSGPETGEAGGVPR